MILELNFNFFEEIIFDVWLILVDVGQDGDVQELVEDGGEEGVVLEELVLFEDLFFMDVMVVVVEEMILVVVFEIVLEIEILVLEDLVV